MKETIKYLKWLEKEVANLDKQRKHYKIQSEWFKMMYPKMIELETLRKVVGNEK